MGSINLALNKSVSASSYVMPYSPNRAVDGSTVPTNRWLCNTLPSWLSVDLGAQYSINRWVVRHMPVAGWKAPDYCMSDFKLQVSNDNKDWKDVDSVSNNTSIITDRTMPTVVSCRYVRVYVTKGLQTNNKLASFMELEVYQAPASALLTGLALSKGTLNPAFVNGTFSYSSSVDYSTSSITVTPTAQDSNAVIKVNGTVVASGTPSLPVNLNVGANNITVQVTAADGASQNTYVIAVTRQSSSNLINLVATVNSNNVVSGFVKTTTSYNANVGYDGSSIIVTPTVEDPTATTVISINSSTVPSGQSASLNVGSNTITVTVTATSGASTIYTLTVIRASSSNLTNLVVKNGRTTFQINPTFDKNTTGYTTSVGTITTVTITPSAEDINAVIKVNGTVVPNNTPSSSIVLNTGVNNIYVTVTSNIGGIVKTYTVSISK